MSQLSRARFAVDAARAVLSNTLQDIGKPIHAGPHPRADVEGHGIDIRSGLQYHLGCEEVRNNHILHVHVVSGLLAVAEDSEFFRRLQPLAKNRHHTSLPMRILPGSKDVGIP